MPVYEYLCPECGTKTEDYPATWAERQEEIPCGSCEDATASIVPSTFAPDFSSANYRHLLHTKREIPWEPGLDRDIARNREERVRKRKKAVADAVKETVTDAFTVTASA